MKYWNYIKHLLLPAAIFGSLSGILTGAVISLYRFCASHIIHISGEIYAHLRTHPLWIAAAVGVMALAAFLYSNIYRRMPNLQGGGIPTSIAALRGLAPVRWVCDLLGVFTLSMGTFLLGVPLGNEGPSVQMGTAIGAGCVRTMAKKHRAWSRYSMTGGACAGFAAATGAPISGILFALEDAHRRLSPMIIMTAFFSVVFSSVTCTLLVPVFGMDTVLFSVPALPVLSPGQMWIPALTGLAVGMFAVLFLKYYEGIRRFIKKMLCGIPLFFKLFAVLLLTLAAGLIADDFISTGHHLIAHLLETNPPLLMLIAIIFVRATLTLLANTSGMTGGLFLPIMALGASFSAILAEFAAVLPGGSVYHSIILTLGITACISGMMKTPITAIAFAVEALGCHENIIPVIITAALSFTVTEIFRVESINERVVESRLESQRRGIKPQIVEREVTVSPRAFAVGKQVRDIFWPNNLYVLSIRHTADPAAIVAESEDKSIRAHDILRVRYTTYDPAASDEELNAIIGDAS